jgi:ATP-binding cassette subfamily F protein uup
MTESLLSASALTYRIAERTLMGEVNFTVTSHSRIGLIGDNGAGKSTLLRLLSGELQPDGGSIARRQGLRLGFLEQVPTLAPVSILEALRQAAHTSVAAQDAAAEGWSDAAAQHRLERAASLWNLGDLTRSCQTLSGGLQKRVALARLMLEEPDLMLMDEPTNHLDTETVQHLERWLSSSRTAAVIVTHDRYFLDRVTDQMAELRAGTLKTYRGNYTDYLLARAAEEAVTERTESRARRVLVHELDWASRSPQARTTKNRARLDRIQESKTALSARALPTLEPLRFAEGPRLGKTILSAHQLVPGYHSHAPLCAPFDLDISQGERWGILGPNGVGKTTLINTLIGRSPPLAGTVTVGLHTEVAYFDQHRTTLDPEARVIEALVPEGGDTVFVGGVPQHVASYIARFAFDASVLQARIGSLSGGERNRLGLAQLMRTRANVLVLDEPTNDLDLLTLHVLEQAVLHFVGCVIVISHDRYFLDRVATHVLALTPQGAGGAQVEVAVGGYSTWVAQHQAPKVVAVQARAPETLRPMAKKRPALSYKETQELSGMDDAIEAAEARVAELSLRLGDPQLWQAAGGAEGRALQAEHDAATAAAAALYTRWQVLLDKAENDG